MTEPQKPDPPLDYRGPTPQLKKPWSARDKILLTAIITGIAIIFGLLIAIHQMARNGDFGGH